MKIAQKFIFLAAILFTSSIAVAQSTRHTSFDDRQLCDENNGVWREFGNGCADNCEGKFNKYEICTGALTYACDCGKGRCWHEKKCLSVDIYKKIFETENAEKEKFLEAKARERHERIKNDPTLSNYLQNLYVQRDAVTTAQNPQNGQGQQPQTTAPQQAQQNIISQAATPHDIPNPSSSVTQVQGVLAAGSNPSAAPADIGNKEIKVPPIFLEQQKQQAATNAAAGGSAAPSLPVIPLP